MTTDRALLFAIALLLAAQLAVTLIEAADEPSTSEADAPALARLEAVLGRLEARLAERDGQRAPPLTAAETTRSPAAAGTAGAAAMTGDSTVAALASVVERLDRVAEELRRLESTPQMVERPMDVAQVAAAREVLETTDPSQYVPRFFGWTPRDLHDRFGTPTWVSRSQSGEITWLYSLDDRRGIRFEVNDGIVTGVGRSN